MKNTADWRTESRTVYPVVQRLHLRDRPFFSDRQPFVCRAPAYLRLDGIQLPVVEHYSQFAALPVAVSPGFYSQQSDLAVQCLCIAV